jgi:hypothetical protein
MRSLNQTERDLDSYAQEKAYRLIKDVVQAFDIAGQPRTQGLACLGALMLRLAATLAVNSDADRERWLRYCNDVFNIALKSKEENDDDDE